MQLPTDEDRIVHQAGQGSAVRNAWVIVLTITLWLLSVALSVPTP